MDTAQIVLLAVIVVLTILLIVLGIQVFYILKDLRKTIRKANKVLDDTHVITESVAGPVSSISQFSESFQVSSLISLAKFIKGILGRESKAKREEE